MATKKINRSVPGTIFLALLLIVFGTFMALPLVYSVLSAFKPPEEFFLFPPRFFVRNPTVDNYYLLSVLISNMWVSFERYLFNSAFVSVTATLLYLLIATLAAYPLSKHRFPGRTAISKSVTLALLFTTSVTALPQYIIMARLGLIDTYGCLIFPALSSTMGVFLCIQYLETLPDEMLESARIDGAGEMMIWRRVVLPNIRPAIMTIMIFQFQGVWNQNGANLIYSEELKVLPAAVSQISSAGISRAGVGSAAAVIMMIPPVLVFILAQNQVMETMVHSGIKG